MCVYKSLCVCLCVHFLFSFGSNPYSTPMAKRVIFFSGPSLAGSVDGNSSGNSPEYSSNEHLLIPQWLRKQIFITMDDVGGNGSGNNKKNGSNSNDSESTRSTVNFESFLQFYNRTKMRNLENIQIFFSALRPTELKLINVFHV